MSETSKHNPGVFKEATFLNRRGQRLRAYAAVTVSKPRGVVISHHGIRAHGLFEVLRSDPPGGPRTCVEGSIAGLYLEAGFAVYTYDCEGHGLSDSAGNPGYFDSCWDLAEDLLLFARLVRKERPTLPVFASACSMGGGIVVGAAVTDSSAFEGLILAAPMISVEKVKSKGLNQILVPVAPTLLAVMPFMKHAQLVAFPQNPDLNDRKTFQEDPLTVSTSMMMAGPAFASLTFCIDLTTKLENLQTPFLTMHAKGDTFTDYESSEMLMENSKSEDKTFLEPPPGSHHALFGEEASRDWTRKTVLDWLSARCH